MAEVSRETIGGRPAFLPPPNLPARLSAYADLLARWNRSINLVAPSDLAHLWSRHIQDCLQLAELMPPVDCAADLGSGAGFPGLVLALATGVPFHLVEADRRKAAFLREAIRATGAPATVHPSRIETLQLPPLPLIVARALAPLPVLLRWTRPLLQTGGVCLFLKGASAEAEVTDARADWDMQVERFASRTNPAATILRISALASRN